MAERVFKIGSLVTPKKNGQGRAFRIISKETFLEWDFYIVAEDDHPDYRYTYTGDELNKFEEVANG